MESSSPSGKVSRMQEEKRKVVGIGVPIVEVVKGVMVNPLMMLAAEVILSHRLVVITPINQLPHDRAREMCMVEAKRKGCDYLLFVDSDNPPMIGAFSKLYETLKKEKCVCVAAWYWMRGPPYLPVWTKVRKLPEGFPGQKVLGDKIFVGPDAGPQEVDMCGMGFTLIDLHWVWENMEAPYFRFGTAPENNQLWEDIEFCIRVREAGGRVMGDPRVRLDHLHEPLGINDETVGALREAFVKEVAERSKELKEVDQEQVESESKRLNKELEKVGRSDEQLTTIFDKEVGRQSKMKGLENGDNSGISVGADYRNEALEGNQRGDAQIAEIYGC